MTSRPGVVATAQPRRRNSSAMISTSRIAGTSLIVVRPGASNDAAINFSTLFFAPLTVTSPTSLRPPTTLIRSTGEW